jgi:hypothetical protein
MAWTRPTSCCVTIDTERPERPARAVRPDLNHDNKKAEGGKKQKKTNKKKQTKKKTDNIDQ